MFQEMESIHELAHEAGHGHGRGDEPVPEWRAVHDHLRRNAGRRAELDVEEARWLRRAEEIRIWRRFGCATVFEYLERELGYGPRESRDRLRVARALGDLPEIEHALGDGALRYSAVRELTRVATRANEDAWIDQARGKNLRQIEELVSGRRRGDDPDDTPDPELRLRRIPFEDISPETYALLRQARTSLADETASTSMTTSCWRRCAGAASRPTVVRPNRGRRTRSRSRSASTAGAAGSSAAGARSS